MSADNLAPTRYWYIPRQGFEARIRHRLQTDLGLEDAAADAILCLRTQVLELQAQLHVLEVELAAQTAGQNPWRANKVSM